MIAIVHAFPIVIGRLLSKINRHHVMGIGTLSSLTLNLEWFIL
jgi:hypothetical protein